ncbi:MAG TPA: cold shock domain-containing protein, partial [Dermatophilaceae bacterium]|nr:cold shock domain-containing protein [Dermatophilaceae bacterium]
MREQGTLADWHDDRGFGFITPVAGGPRVFVHVSAFPRGQRPATNDLVTYGVGRDQRNRLSASDVLY